MFAYFQCTDSVLPNSDGSLLTAVPVLTIRVANREVKLVLDYPARQRGRTLHWPSDAALMGVANWDTVNPRKFSPKKKLFSSNSRKFSPVKEARYTGVPKLCRRLTSLTSHVEHYSPTPLPLAIPLTAFTVAHGTLLDM